MGASFDLAEPVEYRVGEALDTRAIKGLPAACFADLSGDRIERFVDGGALLAANLQLEAAYG